MQGASREWMSAFKCAHGRPRASVCRKLIDGSAKTLDRGRAVGTRGGAEAELRFKGGFG